MKLRQYIIKLIYQNIYFPNEKLSFIRNFQTLKKMKLTFDLFKRFVNVFGSLSFNKEMFRFKNTAHIHTRAAPDTRVNLHPYIQIIVRLNHMHRTFPPP